MLVVSQLHGSVWIRVEGANAGLEPLGMRDNSFEVFDTDANPELLLDRKLLKVQGVDCNGRVQGMLEYLYW